VAITLGALAEIARDRGEYARAAAMMRERLALTHDIWGVHWAIAGMAGIAAEGGEHARAARLFGAAEANREARGIGLGPAARATYAARAAPARAALGEAAFAAQWAAGRALTLAEAVAEAMAVMAPPPEPAAGPDYPASHSGLTPRELEVVRLVAAGRSNREIANALSVSIPTIKRHLTNVLGKLGLPSRSALNTYAHAHGLA
jgi:DNA-binding CsgD family transcriptional regulator